MLSARSGGGQIRRGTKTFRFGLRKPFAMGYIGNMATPIEQLDLMRNLRENWDGYNAAPPLPEVIELAKEIVEFIASVRKTEPRYDGIFVTPGRDGGVLIEWQDHRFEHEMEINGDGSIGILRTDKSTQHTTEKVFKPGRFAVPPGFVAAFSTPLTFAA